MKAVSALILAAAIVAAALIVSGRYTMQAAGQTVVVLDRLTGETWDCNASGPVPTTCESRAAALADLNAETKAIQAK